MAPRVIIDPADVAVDQAHMSATLASSVRLTSGSQPSGLTLGDPVDPLTSCLRIADAINRFLD